MLQFTEEEVQKIYNGSITTTFRAWQTLEVKAGDILELDEKTKIQIDTLGWLTASQIGKKDLALAGYRDFKHFVEELRRYRMDFEPMTQKVVRITFHVTK